MAALFVVMNRGAYGGYFSADDLDNLGWTRTTALEIFARGLLSPEYFTNHFRPVGHFLFRILGASAGLSYAWYAAFIQALHLVNAVLLWKVLRRSGLTETASAAGVGAFLFHMSVYPVVWKPMYLFDLCCTLFCLLSALAYFNGRWIISLISFWLAYKSKEQAVMLPLVLLLLGDRNWKRLAPLFAVSALFGVQGLLKNHELGQSYALSFDTRTFWFYGPAMLCLIPLLVFGLTRQRFWLGMCSMALMMAPLLVLPNRLDEAYVYASLPWLAFAVAGALDLRHWGWVLAFLLVWIPLNYRQVPDLAENRAYVEALSGAKSGEYIYDGFPASLQPWGIQGALRFLVRDGPVEVTSFAAGAPEGTTMLGWNFTTKKLHVLSRREQPVPYLNMTHPMPLWQLGEGWYQTDDGFRWSKPHGAATLLRPSNAEYFEMNINASEAYLQAVKLARLRVRVEGAEIGVIEVTTPYWQRQRLKISRGREAIVRVDFDVEPSFQSSRDGRVLGVPLGGFGFIEGTKP